MAFDFWEFVWSLATVIVLILVFVLGEGYIRHFLSDHIYE